MFDAPQARILLATVAVVVVGSGLVPLRGPDVGSESLDEDQVALIDFAIQRFEGHGLELPHIEFVFHDSLTDCDFHKGRYYRDTDTVEMCSLDRTTMVHEMAHAWLAANLSATDRERFVEMSGLDSWNDHDHVWERRGTEHAAETMAWALLDNPHHVKWVETLADGTRQISYRILTIGAEVETLVENFEFLTGMEPVFRHPTEWAVDAAEQPRSPEV